MGSVGKGRRQADSASLAALVTASLPFGLSRHRCSASSPFWAQPALLLVLYHCVRCSGIADAMHLTVSGDSKVQYSKVQSGQVASMGVHARSRTLYTICAGMRRARAMQGTGSTGDDFIYQYHCQPDQLHRRCSRAVSLSVCRIMSAIACAFQIKSARFSALGAEIWEIADGRKMAFLVVKGP